MKPVTLAIGCKINLYLEITGRRADGFHELRTLFYPLGQPGDTLTLEMDPGRDGLYLTCSDPGLKASDNLVTRAFESFAARTGFRPGLKAHLLKDIPSGAGLGGGSADAAAMLAWLNSQAGHSALSPGELAGLALGLGADVPFFLLGKPCLATGVGEVLKPVDCPQLLGLSVVLVLPRVSVSTAWAYRAWDERAETTEVKGKSMFLTSFSQPVKRPFCVSGLMVANSFEAVVFPAFPRLRDFKESLLAMGAAASAMSGSGSAVFGLFRDTGLAGRAGEALAAKAAAVHVAKLEPVPA